MQVVARVPGLTLLNGSTVDARERRDCELHYLRGLLALAEERPAQLQVPPLAGCALRLRVWASVLTASPVAYRRSALVHSLRRVSPPISGTCVHECHRAALPTRRAVRHMQALEAKHARLAPLRRKYGGMTGTLATTTARQGGTPPMAASMLTLHLVRDNGTSEAARHSLPIPGDWAGVFRCSFRHLFMLCEPTGVQQLQCVALQVPL